MIKLDFPPQLKGSPELMALNSWHTRLLAIINDTQTSIATIVTDHGQLAGLSDDDHSHYLLASGSRELTGNWDAGAFEIKALALESDVLTGSIPIKVASSTLCSNLNADLLDGYHYSDIATLISGSYVPYSGATGPIDLGSQNLTTAGDLTCDTLNYTTLNPAIDLSSRVPYSGATGDVDLGSYDLTATELIASNLTLGKNDDLDPTITFDADTNDFVITWDEDNNLLKFNNTFFIDKTLDIYNSTAAFTMFDSGGVGTGRYLQMRSYTDTDPFPPQLDLYKSRGSFASPTATQSGDMLGQFLAFGYTSGVGAKFYAAAGFRVYQDGATTASGDMPGRLSFVTRLDGGTGSLTEWVSVKNDGTLLINYDNQLLKFGAGQDACIYYDGTDLRINPQLVGNGVIQIENDGTKSNRISFLDGTNAASRQLDLGFTNGSGGYINIWNSSFAVNTQIVGYLLAGNVAGYWNVTSGLYGFGTSTPARKLESLDTSNPQLRLTHTAAVDYADFQVDTNGDLTINVSGDEIILSDRLKHPGTFAGIHVHDNTTAQTIPTGATYTKSTAFTDNGYSSNVTPDATNDKITITKAGYYTVNGAFSFKSGTANVTFYGAVFLNGVEQDQIHWERKVGAAGDLGAAPLTGLIDVTTVPWDLDFRVRHDNGGSIDLTITYANLNVEYKGET